MQGGGAAQLPEGVQKCMGVSAVPLIIDGGLSLLVIVSDAFVGFYFIGFCFIVFCFTVL